MRLLDLHPKYGGGTRKAGDPVRRTHLIFDCPNCSHHEEKCRIVIPFAGEGTKWEKIGDDFATMSLSPSIWFNKGKSNPTTCESHFFIKNGEIIIA